MHEHHHHEVSGKRLFFTILLNLLITIAEAIGGFLSGSISLLSDATHNFSDVISLIISYIANRLTKKKATNKQTYGYKRSEIIAAFFNSSTLLIISFFILYEAVLRLITPTEISSDIVIYLAFGSILVNGLSVLFIKKDAHNNMNMKSAYLHLFSDMMTSIAVMLGGFAVKFLHWYWIDAVLSIGIAIYLMYLSWGIFKSSLKIIMQFTPENIDIQKIADKIELLDEIKNIHHIHIWQIDEHHLIFEAHIDLQNNINISDFENILQKIKIILSKNSIKHVTIQPEFNISDNKNRIHN